MYRKHGVTRRRVLGLGWLVTGAAYAAVAITVGDTSGTVVNGAGTTINFPVTRSGDTSAPVTVGYATVDGSAVGGTDYTAAIGNLTIPASATSGTIPVAVTGEAGVKPDKQFSMVLMGVGGNGLFPAFGPVSNFNLGGFPFNGGGPIAVADFNGDGKVDAAVANTASSKGNYGVSVFINTTTTGATTASFSPAMQIATAQPVNLVTADFNADGKPDLAVFTNTGVSVLLNTTGAGATAASFASAADFPGSNNPGPGFLAADFNGDGRPDLVFVGGSGLTFELNTTAAGASLPTFSSYDYPLTEGSSNFPLSLTTADFNNDGKPDIALLYGVMESVGEGFTSYFVEVRLNTTPAGSPTPSFSAPVKTTFSPVFTSGSGFSLGVGDFNNDGRLDLAVAAGSAAPSESVVVTLLDNTSNGGRTGSYTASPVSYGAFFTANLLGADFNGDGKTDLLLMDRADGSQYINFGFLCSVTGPGSETAQFSPPVNVPFVGNITFASLSTATADFNGDGLPDVAAAGQSDAEFTVLLNSTQPGPAFQAGGPNVAATGTIHYQSNVPNSFSFAPVSNAALDTLYTSNAITVSGTNAPSPISISGGQYSINGGAYTASAGTVQPNDAVTAQVRSSSAYFTSVQAVVTIGGVNGTYSVTTQPASSSSSSGGSSSSSGSGSSSSSSGGSSSSSSSGGSSSGSGSSSSGGGSGGGGGGGFSPLLILGFGLARLLRSRRRPG